MGHGVGFMVLTTLLESGKGQTSQAPTKHELGGPPLANSAPRYQLADPTRSGSESDRTRLTVQKTRTTERFLDN